MFYSYTGSRGDIFFSSGDEWPSRDEIESSFLKCVAKYTPLEIVSDPHITSQLVLLSLFLFKLVDTTLEIYFVLERT